MRAAIEQQLAAGSRAPLALLMSAVDARDGRPRASASIVVIDRGANTLQLYNGRGTLVRTLPRRDRAVDLPDAVGRLRGS